ncbi:MAG: hypothetical protein KBD53_11120 [Candidatus Omnitrophica bacterium]|nr:hypothetical protein [Candidatus Omnitrophota bacterium]
MKRKLNIIIFVFITAVMLVKAVFAETDWHVPSQDSLSISLNGLRQSAQDMAERNNWLKSELNVLEMKIESYQKQMSAPYGQERNKDIQLRAENAVWPKLEERMISKSQEEEKLLKEVALVTSEIQQLNKLIMQEQDKQVAPAEPEEVKLAVLQASVKDLQNRIKAFNKDHSKSLGRLDILKEKNALLKQKVTLLTDYYEKAEANKKEISTDLEGMDGKNAKLIEEINKEISELRTEGDSLDGVLKEANNKIHEKRIDFNITEEEIDLLGDNLHFMEKENNVLKEKVNRAEENLKKFDQSAHN